MRFFPLKTARLYSNKWAGSIFPLLLLLLTSCYRMPGENEYSLIPTTNNPAITHEKPGSLLPGGMGY